MYYKLIFIFEYSQSLLYSFTFFYLFLFTHHKISSSMSITLYVNTFILFQYAIYISQ